MAFTRATVAANGSVLLAAVADSSGSRLVLQRRGQPDATIPAVFGPGGSAMVGQPDGKFLVAATIQRPGLARGLARLNADGTLDSTFDVGQLNTGTVLSISLQPDGRVLVGGMFEEINGTRVPRLVRLRDNGSLDTSFDASGAVTASTVHQVVMLRDGNMLVQESTGRLLRIMSTGALDSVLGQFSYYRGSAAELLPGMVMSSVVQPDGRVLLGGKFHTFNGIARRNLIRLNADGSLDRSFDPSVFTGEKATESAEGVSQIALQPDGKIFFTTAQADHFVRLNIDGSFEPSFTPGRRRPPPTLRVVPMQDGRVVIAGEFTHVDGISRPGIARLNKDGALDLTFVPTPGMPAAFRGLVVQPDGSVIVAADALSDGSTYTGLARFSAAGLLDGSFVPALAPGVNAPARVTAITARPDGRLRVVHRVGNFRSFVSGLMPSGALDLEFGPRTEFVGDIRLLVSRPGGGLFAAGDFTLADRQTRHGLAALSATGALDREFAAVEAPNVLAMAAAPDGSLYIGGLRFGPQRLTARGQIDPAFSPASPAGATVTALSMDQTGRVIGAFNRSLSEDQATTQFLVRYGPTGTIDHTLRLGTGPKGHTHVAQFFQERAALTSLTANPDGSVLAGGNFSEFDDLPAGSFVRVRSDGESSPVRSRLHNISVRGSSDGLIAGFIIEGPQRKSVLLRAVGPGLADFGVASAAQNPSLTLYRAQGANPVALLTNESWNGTEGPSRNPLPHEAREGGFDAAYTAGRVGAFPLQSGLEAAIPISLEPGVYTAVVGSSTSAVDQGISLLEVYDSNTLDGARRLANLSARGISGSGEKSLIAGFIITGSENAKVLVRGIGPALSNFGVGDALADPILTVVDAAGRVIATNDDWLNEIALTEATNKSGAFVLPEMSRDSALVLELPAGNYSAIVTSKGSAAGVALVEVHEIR